MNTPTAYWASASLAASAARRWYHRKGLFQAVPAGVNLDEAVHGHEVGGAGAQAGLVHVGQGLEPIAVKQRLYIQ